VCYYYQPRIIISSKIYAKVIGSFDFNRVQYYFIFEKAYFTNTYIYTCISNNLCKADLASADCMENNFLFMLLVYSLKIVTLEQQKHVTAVYLCYIKDYIILF